MRRILIKFVLASALATSGATVQAATLVCASDPVLLRDVTIVDASGEWTDQDIFIEDGEISVIGSDLELETTRTVRVMDRPGSIVRPTPAAPATGRLVIRASLRAAPAETKYLMPGLPADMVVEGNGRTEFEIRGGRLIGTGETCFNG